jgi:hypothetical protein
LDEDENEMNGTVVDKVASRTAGPELGRNAPLSLPRPNQMDVQQNCGRIAGSNLERADLFDLGTETRHWPFPLAALQIIRLSWWYGGGVERPLRWLVGYGDQTEADKQAATPVAAPAPAPAAAAAAVVKCDLNPVQDRRS